MPMYEYYCRECDTHIEKIRPAEERDAPIACPTDPAHRPKRLLSVFVSRSGTSGDRAVSTMESGGGGCACGGHCSCRN